MLDPVRAYLEAPRCAILATLGPDGAPHAAVVHYLVEQDELLVNGRPDRRWLRNLRRDGRFALVVHDHAQPLRWVGVKGDATFLRAGADAVEDAMALARRYGEDPAEYRDQERVSLRLVPRRVHEYA
jgi:PPOX class probable F420-dependent enzyme